MQDQNLILEKPLVFISYAKEDASIATKLYNKLKRDGLKPWLDLHHLPTGVKWESTIEETIKGCRFFLLILSEKAINKKGFIQKEIKMAFNVAELMPVNSVFILPLKVDNCEVPSILLKYQWLDYTRKRSYSKLKTTIIKYLGKDYTPPLPIKKIKSKYPVIHSVFKKISFDKIFLNFCSQTGNLILCKPFENNILVSNSHILEIRKNVPKRFVPSRVISEDKFRSILPLPNIYRKSQNVIISIEPQDEKKYLLTAKNGNSCYAAVRYVDYFITKYYKCDIYVWSDNYLSIIPIDHNNNLVGAIMPMAPNI